MRKLLVKLDSPLLRPLSELVGRQRHKTLVWWSIDCAERVLPIFEKNHPLDLRPRKAVEAAKTWARGEIKMPVAKKAAHASHNAATEVVDEDAAACAAARAAGHVVGTVHVATHAMAFVLYTITAFIYNSEDPGNAEDIVVKESEWLHRRLLYWEENIDYVDTTWASFLQRDDELAKEDGQKKKT